MPSGKSTQSINITVLPSLEAFRKRSRRLGDFPSKAPFQMSVADSPATPSSARILYGGSVAPKKRSVVCLLSHPYISACKGPMLRSRIALHLLFLVLEARFVSELRDAHAHACPVTIYLLACRYLDQLGSRDPFLLVKFWVLGV